jgi:hypothetical protein
MNKMRTLRVLVTIAFAMTVVFLLFALSAALLGPWWRLPNLPTADEWSALWGIAAVVALFFAWRQLRQVDQSNKQLVASNELTRQVNLETLRPRVLVSLDYTRTISRQRGGPAEGQVWVAIENIGSNVALDVRLTVDRPFQSLPQFFKAGKMEEHLSEMTEAFDGRVLFDSLVPGKKYVWFLGRVPDLFKDESGVTRRYQIEARYSGLHSSQPYRHGFVIDLDTEKRIQSIVDPLQRIGRDLEVIGEKLGNIESRLRD